LHRLPIYDWKAGAPDLMTTDELVKTLLKGSYIQRAGKADGETLVICWGIGHQPGKEPELLLSERQRSKALRRTWGNGFYGDGSLWYIPLQIFFE